MASNDDDHFTGEVDARYLTREERVARGKAARAEVPRSRHAELRVGAREDPIALLEQQARARVPELIPVRHARMRASPFAYYRGCALSMASDLSQTPSTGLRAQLCGDAHLKNFGLSGSPERKLVFDLNDFDETQPGPWEWDVKRLATSFELAARGNGYSEAQRRSIVLEVASSYRTAMIDFAAMRNLEVWYAHMDIETAMADYGRAMRKKQLKRTAKVVAKARERDSLHALDKLSYVVAGQRRLVSNPPLIVPVAQLFGEGARAQFEAVIEEAFWDYRKSLASDRRVLLDQFRFHELARKVVGVGSVGTRCWVALFLGVDQDDPLFIQVKEAESSVLERFTGKSGFAQHGERVVRGQRLMQATSDLLLGWGRGAAAEGPPHDYYFRQLRDWKGSFEVERMVPAGMSIYARACGWTLARAHARSGDRVALAAYLGKSDAFDQAIGRFAVAYADQTERDFASFEGAIRSGRLPAESAAAPAAETERRAPEGPSLGA